MADTISPQKRSEVMRRVRGKNTSIEIQFRKALWAAGLRGYRVNLRKLPGNPDVVFGPAKVAIFIDGCYWHGCPKHCRMPSSNREYWETKIGRNIQRDKTNRAALRKAGWRVLRFWEHEIKKSPERAALRTAREIQKR
jgi:DNA mismatch endonuclease Vsr